MSGADYLSTKVGNCRYVDIIERAGHAIAFDRPGAYAKVLNRFIQENVSVSYEQNIPVCIKSKV